eukprot:1144653-Pelagomonas_calceolata.AAC.8
MLGIPVESRGHATHTLAYYWALYQAGGMKGNKKPLLPLYLRQGIMEISARDLTKLRTHFQHTFSPAPPSSASCLRDFMNQLGGFGYRHLFRFIYAAHAGRSLTSSPSYTNSIVAFPLRNVPSYSTSTRYTLFPVEAVPVSFSGEALASLLVREPSLIAYSLTWKRGSSSSSIPSPSTNTNNSSSASSTCTNIKSKSTVHTPEQSQPHQGSNSSKPLSSRPNHNSSSSNNNPGREHLTFKHQNHPSPAAGAAAPGQNTGGAVKKGQAASAVQDSQARACKMVRALKGTRGPPRCGTSGGYVEPPSYGNGPPVF